MFTLFLFPLVLAIPAAVIVTIVHPYSRAFIAGIASARDPSHRMTPLSPWFFFDPHWRKIRGWSFVRLVIYGLLIPAMVVLVVMFVSGYGSAINPEVVLWWAVVVVCGYLVMLGYIAAVLAAVFRLAPRFSSPGALTTVGVILGGAGLYVSTNLASILVLLLLWEFGYYWGPFGFILRPLTSFALGLGVLWLTIRITRRPGNEAWFRFET